MAESPVHLLIRIMASKMNSDIQESEYVSSRHQFCLAHCRSPKVSDLQVLSTYFVADVVADIFRYYEELASSWPIPQTYLRRCSLVQIAESVALELHAYSTVGGHELGDKRNGGNQGSQGGGQCGGGGGGGQGGGGDRGGQGGDRIGPGQGGRSGRVQRAIGPSRPESQPFRDVAHTIISVETPQKNSHNRKQFVHQAAKDFLLDPTVVLQKNAYDPSEEITALNKNKKRLLFHGTRKSNMFRFRFSGVEPTCRPNEMSDGPAFYTTNSIQQAVAHVLYAHPNVKDLTVDPIVVLVFSVDITVLHGDQPPLGSSSKFLVNWYKHESAVHRERFIEVCVTVLMAYYCSSLFQQDVKYNLQLTSPLEVTSIDHVQIGPICLVCTKIAFILIF